MTMNLSWCFLAQIANITAPPLILLLQSLTYILLKWCFTLPALFSPSASSRNSFTSIPTLRPFWLTAYTIAFNASSPKVSYEVYESSESMRKKGSSTFVRFNLLWRSINNFTRDNRLKINRNETTRAYSEPSLKDENIFIFSIRISWASKHGPFTSIFHSCLQSVRVKIFEASLHRIQLHTEFPESFAFGYWWNSFERLQEDLKKEEHRKVSTLEHHFLRWNYLCSWGWTSFTFGCHELIQITDNHP